MHDVTIADIAGVGLVLGGLAAWILSNERRTAALERSREEAVLALERSRQEAAATILRIDASIEALHERLDEYFTGHDSRPPREKP